MNFQKVLMTSSVMVLAALTATPALAQSSDFTPVTQEMLNNPDDGDWLHFRRTNDSWGHSPLNEINRDNVGGLTLAWGWAMEPGVQEATPLVYDGVMYLVNPGGIVQALDAASGDLIWEYRREMPAGFPAGALSRGLSIFEDKIYLAAPDAAVVALDARNGSVVWESQVGDHAIGKRFTAAPIIADGKVLTALTGCSRFYEEKCGITAHDATNGEELWRTITVQRPGEDNDTWNDLPMLLRGGGDTWVAGSYDEERGLVLFGVSQAKPWSRASRGHDEAVLYTNSTLALDIDSGEIKWYRQYVPGETHDMDEAFEHILVDIDGQPAALTMGKLAVLWRTNRDTGESMPAFDLGWQDQIDIDPASGEFVDYRPGMIPEIGVPMKKCPTTAGFKSWRSMAYSPETRAVYIPMSMHCDDGAVYAEVEFVEGGGGTAKPGRVNTYHPKYPEHIGNFVAVSVDTGEMLWEHPVRTPANTSMLTTAGGVVFGGDWNRNFYAFDEATGEVLWQTRLPQAPQGFPVAYMADGKQHIAVPIGVGGASWQTSVPADLVPEVKRPSTGNAVMVFTLP